MNNIFGKTWKLFLRNAAILIENSTLLVNSTETREEQSKRALSGSHYHASVQDNKKLRNKNSQFVMRNWQNKASKSRDMQRTSSQRERENIENMSALPQNVRTLTLAIMNPFGWSSEIVYRRSSGPIHVCSRPECKWPSACKRDFTLWDYSPEAPSKLWMFFLQSVSELISPDLVRLWLPAYQMTSLAC